MSCVLVDQGEERDDRLLVQGVDALLALDLALDELAVLQKLEVVADKALLKTGLLYDLVDAFLACLQCIQNTETSPVG